VFEATDGTHGYELWVTDGTAAGTQMVLDINPGSSGSNPSHITSLGNGTAVFDATDGTHFGELWITDGTAAGTHLDSNSNSTFVSYPRNFSVLSACYRRGTRILTDKGEVKIEELAIGDHVVTAAGETRPIRWIGRRAYDGRFIGGHRETLPIRIAADALSDGVPARDLWVSPGHSLYLDGVLVLAEHLINGATIVQADSVESVEYFHIELDTHDILIADGAPAESFVDCDNRLMFANGADYAELYPEDDRPGWEFCVPRLEWGADELTAIRARVLQRAEAQGHCIALDPDLHLVVGGAVVRPDSATGLLYRFTIPAGSAAIWLASRNTVPAELVPESRDTRRLGVPVERLVLSDGETVVEARHGHTLLCDGFHDNEATHRWTDGRARIPDRLLQPFVGAVTVDVHLIPSGLGYRLVNERRIAAAA